MIQAKKRRKKAGIPEDRIHNIRQNVFEWKGDAESYDAVVAQFFFDNFYSGNLKHIAEKIFNCLKPDGKLLVSEYHIPTDTRIGNWRARLTISLLYSVFGVLTGLQTRRLEDYATVLTKFGFSLEKVVFFSQKSLVSQIFRKTNLAD